MTELLGGEVRIAEHSGGGGTLSLSTWDRKNLHVRLNHYTLAT